jgi:hypothetical protein|tara:strand:- start:2242 stop:2436 length:195 start_codon:yes stop_codon:yes gene_type:complete
MVGGIIMRWRLGTYFNKENGEKAIIVQKATNGIYTMRFIGQQKIEQITELDFILNWEHEEGEEE